MHQKLLWRWKKDLYNDDVSAVIRAKDKAYGQWGALRQAVHPF